MRSRWPWWCLLGVCACSAPPSIKVSRVREARVIAVISEPAEASPGDTVQLTAVVASPDGFVDDASIDWATCEQARTPADPTTVAPACLPDASVPDGGMSPVVPLDSHDMQVQLMVPHDACTKIGPAVPLMDAEGNPQSPPNPDVTGGYQLPVRLIMKNDRGQDVTYLRERVKCALADAPAKAATEYGERYQLNNNPTIDKVLVAGSEVPALDGSASLPVDPSGSIEMVVSWPSSAVESYVLLDPETRSIVTHKEHVDVAWYTDGGEFKYDRTSPEGNGDKGNGDKSSNVLQLDADRTKPAQVWLTLRDDRGGAAVARFSLNPK